MNLKPWTFFGLCRRPGSTGWRNSLCRDWLTYVTNFQGSGKDLVCTGVPIKLSETPGEAKMVFAKTGENTDEVLAGIGYSTKQIEQLHKEGIV